jgi:hypothetical protein
MGKKALCTLCVIGPISTRVKCCIISTWERVTSIWIWIRHYVGIAPIISCAENYIWVTMFMRGRKWPINLSPPFIIRNTVYTILYLHYIFALIIYENKNPLFYFQQQLLSGNIAFVYTFFYFCLIHTLFSLTITTIELVTKGNGFCFVGLLKRRR